MRVTFFQGIALKSVTHVPGQSVTYVPGPYQENRDHEVVYALIAKDTGATAESVGRALAKQITANSRPGVWVQDEAGAWKKK